MASSRPGTTLTTTTTLLDATDCPPCLPPIHILPPTSSTSTPTPIPVVIPTLSPTTDPCGDSVLQPAIFSPTAASIPGSAQPVACVEEGKVKDLPSLLAELSLPSEESLLIFIKDGLYSAAESVVDLLGEKAMEDVETKLQLMAEWWNSGKLSAQVKSQLGSLVAALNKQQMDKAHQCHMNLMTHHSTEVDEWMAAVNRIIQEQRTKGKEGNAEVNENLSIELHPVATALHNKDSDISTVENR